MLVQDTLTGAVHEVPESQLYEADYAESPEQMARPDSMTASQSGRLLHS
jgi:hypothetical protein